VVVFKRRPKHPYRCHFSRVQGRHEKRLARHQVLLHPLRCRGSMTTKRLPRPRDPIQLGKLIVDIATGQVNDREDDGKDPAAVARGRLGGKSGGKSRAATLTSETKREIAKKAAAARWSKSRL
jgi:hypothetical protein